MISNQTCAARSFDFEITRMISDKLHSTQFNYHYEKTSLKIKGQLLIGLLILNLLAFLRERLD